MTPLPSTSELEAFFQSIDDWEEKYGYLISLGRKLPPMPDALKNDATRVRGCTSQVWIHAEQQNGQWFWQGDSDASIVKGLVAVLFSFIQGQQAGAITSLNAQSIFEKLGLGEHLSTSRSNGFFAMVKRIQQLIGESS